jgi:hypothetical protein
MTQPLSRRGADRLLDQLDVLVGARVRVFAVLTAGI